MITIQQNEQHVVVDIMHIVVMVFVFIVVVLVVVSVDVVVDVVVAIIVICLPRQCTYSADQRRYRPVAVVRWLLLFARCSCEPLWAAKREQRLRVLAACS